MFLFVPMTKRATNGPHGEENERPCASRRWYSGEVSSASGTPKNHCEKDWILSCAAIAKRRIEKIGKIFFGDISLKWAQFG